MQEKSFRNALHRCHGLFFLHHIKTQVVKERLIGFSERAHLLVLYCSFIYLSPFSMRAQLLKVVVPIKMSAMIAGNEVDIASKDMLTQFAWKVSA